MERKKWICMKLLTNVAIVGPVEADKSSLAFIVVHTGLCGGEALKGAVSRGDPRIAGGVALHVVHGRLFLRCGQAGRAQAAGVKGAAVAQGHCLIEAVEGCHASRRIAALVRNICRTVGSGARRGRCWPSCARRGKDQKKENMRGRKEQEKARRVEY